MAVCLAKVEEEYRDRLAVVWRSFLLRPVPGRRDLEKFRRYTESWQRPAAQPGGGRFRVWATEEPPPSHSVPPNVAVKAAARQGAFDRYHLALMNAYFWDNRCVTERETLVDVASACGLDADAFGRDLDDPVLEESVRADHGDALARGVTAVPTVVVGQSFEIPGSQDIAVYRNVVDKIITRGLEL